MQHKPRNYKTREIIVRFISEYAARTGRQPSVREIGKAASITSTSTIAGYLRRMVNEDLLIHGAQFERNYFLSEKAIKTYRLATPKNTAMATRSILYPGTEKAVS